MNSKALELVKWVALVLMTGDHINRYLPAESSPVLFNAGRIAMPLFMYVLVINLARENAFQNGVYYRTSRRLLAFAWLALVPTIALDGLTAGWWPLNMLFTLAALTTILYLLELKTELSAVAAVCVFIFAGGLVEFLWPALALGVAGWVYQKQPSFWTASGVLAALAALAVVNGNFWAMASIPVALLLSKIDLEIPRIKWFFYAYYPAHLAVIWLIKIVFFAGHRST